MPSNKLEINYGAVFEVPDSKMGSLIAWLLKNASPQNKDAKKLLNDPLY